MQKTITVKGIGSVSAKPDYVMLSMTMESQDRDYEEAMSLAGRKIEQLNETLVSAGFEKDSVKTTNFQVRTDNRSVKDRSGNSHSVFNGYVVKHALKVSFDFDSRRLAQVLSAIAECLSRPNLSVAFTVKDPAAVKEEMLVSAAENARRTAEILCRASGRKLGELAAVSYDWEEIDLYSHTSYGIADDCMSMSTALGSVSIEPDDIDVSDSVTFMWEIV